MTYFDEQLKSLHEQVSRKTKLEPMLYELFSQQSKLSERAEALRRAMQDEQADVDKLEKSSFASFLYGIMGSKAEKLDKERAELLSAKVKYDSAVSELSRVQYDLDKYRAEMEKLRDCEKQYREILKQKAEAIKASGGEKAEKILSLEVATANLSAQLKELGEAIAAGEQAQYSADRVLTSLNSADGWATWDFLGGGVISDMAKHSKINEAQNELYSLQHQLNRFKAELADVKINSDLQLNIGDGLLFADYFFDGLIVDWMVMDKIRRGQNKVFEAKDSIVTAVCRLKSMQRDKQSEQAALQRQLDELIKDTEI